MEGFIVIAIIAAIIMYNVSKPRNCDICGNTFQRVYHTWTIGGKSKHLCPHCNSKMRRRNSNAHF